MSSDLKDEEMVTWDGQAKSQPQTTGEASSGKTKKGKDKDKDGAPTSKRRCVSSACIACRKRKSKCDGNLPKCAACASVYLTECEYSPESDHRRKGVYKKDVDTTKTKDSTLQVLVQALLNYEEEDAFDLVRQIRACESLEELAEGVLTKEKNDKELEDNPEGEQQGDIPKFEAELSGRMGDLLLEGSLKFVGGTSNLVWMSPESDVPIPVQGAELVRPQDEVLLSWTTVTQNKELIIHFLNLYFTWHYAYFTTLSKELFYRDFLKGRRSNHCSPLLVNAMLALGCHFSTRPEARADPEDSSTTGDHYFKEAKRLMFENDEHTNARLCTVQALALMSVREAGCGREGKGWVYSGMSFRMACDLGLNVDAPGLSGGAGSANLTPEDEDARRITFWGCFLFDKCWSNYLGRQPQLQLSVITVPKPDVFPGEESGLWSPYTDAGVVQNHSQPSRTRAVALELSKLCEISSDLLVAFYHPSILEKPIGRQQELKKLTDLHTRLEAWRKALPQEMDAKEGQLAQVLLMHMFFQLLFIHLYRPFLKYTRHTSPLPAHVSPRKFCTQAAQAISKLLRLYKRTYGLRQICNIAVYIAHSACTIHILNLPDKNAKRDIVHGVRQLEEIGECWTCARRTLRILELSSTKWNIELPEEATATFQRCRAKWGNIDAVGSPASSVTDVSPRPQPSAPLQPPTRAEAHMSPRTQATSQMVGSNIPHTPNGFFQPVVPSPASTTNDGRRSSGGLSMPPATAADLARMPTKPRPSTYLTHAQQEAWKAHQAARVSGHPDSGANSSNDRSTRNTSPSILFGGVESLVEESQDWWLRDQSALALGFDNWVDPSVDWSNPNTSPQSVNGTLNGTHGNGVNGGSGNTPTAMNYDVNGYPDPPIGNAYASGYNLGDGFTPAYFSSNGVPPPGKVSGQRSSQHHGQQHGNGGDGRGSHGAQQSQGGHQGQHSQGQNGAMGDMYYG